MTQFSVDNTSARGGASFSARRATRRCGFTMVELMIVVAVIILLLSILIVGMNKAVRGAQSANTRALMGSMKQGLVAFKEDHGYLPPVLNVDRGLEFSFSTGNSFHGPDPTAGTYAEDVQDWYSITSMADYLIGWDHGLHDGYGEAPNGSYAGELPRTGIRSPGGDGAWGSTIYGSQRGALADRNPSIEGRRFGPYLELKDERLLGSTDGTIDAATGQYKVSFPGEPGYNADDPHVIVDYWGTPIRYYRPAYPPGALNSAYPKVEVTNAYNHTVPLPTLSDVFLLRPYELEEGNAINGLADEQTGGSMNNGDPTSVRELLSAEFALHSSGPDRTSEPTQRVDDDEFNRDDIVELGP